MSYASCDGCPAGQCGGLCHHIFALLMVLEYYGPRPEPDVSVPEDDPVTSQPRSWGPRQRNVQPQASMQTVIERPKFDSDRKAKAVACKLYDARAPHARVMTKEEITDMRPMLYPCRLKHLLIDDERDIAYGPTAFGVSPLGSVLSYQLRDTSVVATPGAPPSQLPKTSTAAPGLEACASSLSACPVSFPALPFVAVGYPSDLEANRQLITLEEAQGICKATSGQANNQEWLQYHKTVLTSSNFHKVLRNRNPSISFLSNLFSTKDLSGVASITHGRRYEPVAVDSYCAQKHKAGQSVKVAACGLVLHTSFAFLGASPDRLVFDRSVNPRFGLLEVKCPFTMFRDGLTMTEAAQQPGFCLKESSPGVFTLKHDHAYFTQVQGQMAISGAKWCDFVVWSGQYYHCERVHADMSVWTETFLPRLVRYYTEHCIQYIILRDNPAKSSDLALSERLFPSDICQSRKGGRNGSNACTVIASLFCLRFLQPDDTPSEAQLCAGVERILLDGNAWYDHTGQAGLLAVDEVVQPSIGVENAGELSVS